MAVIHQQLTVLAFGFFISGNQLYLIGHNRDSKTCPLGGQQYASLYLAVILRKGYVTGRRRFWSFHCGPQLERSSFVSVAADVRSPAQASGFRIQHCHSCGVSRSCIWDAIPGLDICYTLCVYQNEILLGFPGVEICSQKTYHHHQRLKRLVSKRKFKELLHSCCQWQGGLAPWG